MSASSTLAAHAGLISLRNEPYAHLLCWERRRALRVLRGVGNRVLMSPSSGVGENTIGVASCFFEPRFSLSRYLTTMRLESVLDHHETVLPHPPPEVVSL